MLPDDRRSLKEALQRIQREERYRERTLRREGRTYLSPRTAPPPPSSPTRIASSGRVVNLTQSPQYEITGNIETSLTLESEENTILQNPSNLFSQPPFIEDLVESPLSSQESQISDEYLFSRPQAINFDHPSTSYEPPLEYLKETWIQQNPIDHNQVINSFEGSPSNLEDPENLPYLETSPNPFALDSDQVVTPYTLEESDSVFFIETKPKKGRGSGNWEDAMRPRERLALRQGTIEAWLHTHRVL